MSETELTNAVALAQPIEPTNGDYDAGNIRVLRDAAHIRKRPDNYIPDTSTRGLHHLVYELIYNSVDEALAGYCKHIAVTIHVDGTLSVSDDGRGIPVDEHPEQKRPTLEVVMTTVGAGGKFDNNAYKVSAGLHGMGAKAVTALSEWTEAQVRRNGRTYVQEYERGYAVTPIKDIGAADHTGTRITFRPDPEIFSDTNFQYSILEDRIRELAFLNRGLSITLRDERDNKEETFCYQGGVAEFVAWLNHGEETDSKIVSIVKNDDVIKVEIAFQYTRGEDQRVRCYANNQYNPEGGTHLSGFRAALTRTLNSYGEKNNLFKDDRPQGEDFREGLTAIVSVQLPNPQFESQTKIRLNNPEVEGVVASAVNEALGRYLEENPKEAQRIIKKVLLAAEARKAAAKARQALRDRKSILSGAGLPGKLMDCTSRDRDSSELFLVEGDSAGGSAESGRDRQYQAVLPLRGKPLNVEKARLEQLLDNKEIVSIISAVGMDIGNADDMSKIRYGKIIILTDADVDGQHIRTLLLTFFFRQMRKLVEAGYIYVARPPLYRVKQKKQIRFVQTKEEIVRELMERGQVGTVLTVAGPPQRSIRGEDLAKLLQTLSELERDLLTLELRGLSLPTFLAKATSAGLPSFRVLLEGHEYWFHTSAEVDAFRVEQEKRLGQPLVVAEELRLTTSTPTSATSAASTTETTGTADAASAAGTTSAAGATSASPTPSASASDARQIYVQELHEVRRLNRTLQKLHSESGFGCADLIPLPRIAGREPPVRYYLDNGDMHKPLPHLRTLTAEIRALGEKGLEITRFKGLGEMNPEELWETTLDPSKRTLLKVTLNDAYEADKMFRILMGEKVEERRDFIYKHAIEVEREEIDYGA